MITRNIFYFEPQKGFFGKVLKLINFRTARKEKFDANRLTGNYKESPLFI